jgi:WD40 repeat protein
MNKKDDTYGMLLSLRSASSPPLLHWKCRIPENQLTAGLVVSPCGHYTVAGAVSGNIYVWSSIGGSLRRTVKAHYRSVTSLSWSDCGAYLVTGGADGMVHAFSLMDLVDRGISDDQSISPVRTWSVHHLPVTSLQPLPSGRMISVSEDGQLVMMELFSETTLMTLQLKNGIQSLAFHDGRIYAGSIQGTIFCIDVNVFAMQQTAQLGVTIKRRRLDETHVDQIYMTDKSEAYKSELCGHEKMVTSLAILAEDSTNVWLVSGDAAGTLRVWDLATRGCVRVIQPWSHSVRTTSSLEESATSTLHPITSILVVPHEQDDIGVGTFSSQKEAKANGISNLVTPLERFSEGKAQALPVPFLSPKRDADTLASWDDTSSSITFQPRVEAAGDDPDDEKVEKADRSDKDNSELNNQRQLVKRLQHELDEAQATIARWEKVNDKLMTKPSKNK